MTTLKVSKDKRTNYTISGRAHTANIDCRLRDKLRKTLKTTLGSVFKRRIINEDSSLTSKQQRGLDVYELHLREYPDNYICSLLHFAVARSDDQLLEYALAHGLRQHGNVHYKDPVGRQPIDVALQKEHIPTIEKLIQHGAEADLTNFLKSLARRNRASTLEGLLQSQIPDQLISSFHLFMMYDTALSSGSWEAIQSILVSQRFRSEISKNEEYLRSFAAKLLFSDQRAWEEYQAELESILDSLVNLGLDINLRWPAISTKQEAWLHIMADGPFLAPLDSMLDRGADINALDWKGRTPLIRAVARADQANVHDQIVKIVHTLIRRGAALHAGNSVWSMTCSSSFWILFETLVNGVSSISHVDSRGLTLLHYTVETSNHDKIDLLLPKCSLTLNRSSPIHGTPLNIACRKEDWRAALKLTAAGCRCSYKDVKAMLNSSKALRPVLLQALKHTPTLCEKSEEEAHRWMLLLAVDVLSNCNQDADLHTLDRLSRWLPSWLKDGQDVAEALTMHTRKLPSACQLQACKILLANKTNPNAYTNNARKMTLLEYAIDQHLFDCAIELLNADADPSLRTTSNRYPLDRVLKVAAIGPEEIQDAATSLTAKLRGMGAKQARRSRLDPVPNLKLFPCLSDTDQSSSSSSSSSSKIDSSSATALSSTSTKSSFRFPRAKLTPGPPPSDPPKDKHSGFNPLHRAILAHDSSLVYLALSAGADPNIPTPITNDYPVVLALAEDRPDILSILLSKYFKHLHPPPSPNGTITTTGIVNPTGADAPGLNWTGSRPNHLADNTHLPRDTLTYLMAAVLKGSTGCVKALLEADAEVNIRAYGYRTVLHFIASAQPKNYVEMTWMIARRGADVFAEEGVQYFTPLHMAVYRKDTRLLEALLSSMVFRAEYEHCKRDTRVYGCGMSPLDFAKRIGWQRGVEVFTKAWESARAGK